MTRMRVRARAGSGRDCAENSVATAFLSGAPDVDCAKPAEGAARPSMAAAPVADDDDRYCALSSFLQAVDLAYARPLRRGRQRLRRRLARGKQGARALRLPALPKTGAMTEPISADPLAWRTVKAPSLEAFESARRHGISPASDQVQGALRRTRHPGG